MHCFPVTNTLMAMLSDWLALISWTGLVDWLRWCDWTDGYWPVCGDIIEVILYWGELLKLRWGWRFKGVKCKYKPMRDERRVWRHDGERVTVTFHCTNFLMHFLLSCTSWVCLCRLQNGVTVAYVKFGYWVHVQCAFPRAVFQRMSTGCVSAECVSNYKQPDAQYKIIKQV